MPATEIIAADTFSRANQSGWGTASDGEIWTQPTGAGVLSVVSNRGQVATNTGANVLLLGSGTRAILDLKVRFSLSAASTDSAGIVFRWLDTNDFLRLEATSGSLTFKKTLAGVTTTLSPSLSSLTLSNTTNYWIHVSAFDATLLANVWADGQSEPAGWMLTCVDASITTGGQYGLYANLAAGADTILFDSFQALILPQVVVQVGGKSYPFDEDTLKIAYKLDERMRAQVTVLDYIGGVFFAFGTKVTITDPVLGLLFSGFVLTDTQNKQNVYPSPAIEHQLDCVDNRHLIDKRRSQKLYTKQYGGTVVADLIQRYLMAEGVGSTFALLWAEQQNEWANAAFSNVQTTTNLTTGNTNAVDLELAPAGVTYTSSSTSGSIPTVTALQLTGTASAVVSNPTASYQIWNGSIAASSTDTFFYTIWISSTSPQISAGLDLIYSDGTSYLLNGNAFDQEDIASDPTADLSGLANDQWYTRTFSNYGIAGKTITACNLILAGAKAGTYTAYFHAITYANNATHTISNIFSHALIANAPLSTIGYFNVSLALVQAANAPVQKIIVTPSGTPGSVGLVKSSLVSWNQTVPSGTSLVIESSLDGGCSWQQLTNGGSLPNLLPGVTMASLLLLYRITYIVTSNPAQPTLSYANFQSIITSAPAMTKTDVAQAYGNAANGSPLSFSAGTLANTTVGGSQLLLSGVYRDYALIAPLGPTVPLSDQTNYIAFGTAFLVGKQFFVNCNNSAATDAKSRLDFAGQWQNFTMECDVQVPDASLGQAGIVYRTTGWQTNNDTYGYLFGINSGSFQFGHGNNSGSGGGAFTNLVNLPITLTANSTHRLKAVVSGNSHTFFLDGIQLISATDSTFPAQGYFGFRVFQASSSRVVAYFNHFSVRSALSGTWQSAPLSISSPGTYGNSVVAWDIDGITDSSSSISMQSSIDGGSTFQSVTNGGPIPNLTAGQSLSAKTLILKATLAAATGIAAPILNGASVQVLQQYSSTGTWSTGVLGTDAFVRVNQSGWGNANDGQAWTLAVGSGAANISNNSGALSLTGGGTTLMQLGSQTATDQSVLARVSYGDAGSSVRVNARFTGGGSGTMYSAYLTGGTSLGLQKNVGGTYTTPASVAFAHSLGTRYWVHLVVTGSNPVTINANAWVDGSNEPTGWMVSAIDSSAQLTNGGFGVGGNLNTGDAAVFSSFTATMWPVPTLPLLNVGRATASLVNWNANLPVNAGLTAATSLNNGLTWQNVGASGNGIAGITTKRYAYTTLISLPLAYYPLSEASGTSAFDGSGNAYTGTIAGGVTLGAQGALQGPDETGLTSMTFNGTSGTIALPSALNGNGYQALTVSGWFNLSTTTLGTFTDLVQTGSGSSHGYALFWSGTTSLTFSVGNGTTTYQTTFSVSPVANAWWHICGVYDGSYVRLYVNGVLQATTAVASITISNSGAAAIGSSTGGNSFFPGSIAQVAILNQALSAAQITALYNTGLVTGFTPQVYLSEIRQASPLASYQLAEASGTSAGDSSGNGHPGTYTGGVTLGTPGPLQGTGEVSLTAATFDGSTGYVALPGAVSLNGATAFSVECWVLPSSSEAIFGRVVASANVNSTFVGFQLGVSPSASGAFFAIGNGTVKYEVDSTTALSPTIWTHLVGVWNGTTLFLYVNGTLQSQLATSGSLGNATFTVNLGRSPDNTSYYQGALAQVALYTTALSAITINGHYAAGLGPGAATFLDTFLSNSSPNYTQGNYAGGTTGTWTWDTSHTRLTGSGGTNGTLLYTSSTQLDSNTFIDCDQADGSGLVANVSTDLAGNRNLYYVQLWDNQATSTQNTLKLFKRFGGVVTQLGASVPIIFVRGTVHHVILDIQGGVLTVTLDGTQLLQQTDATPLLAGQGGLLLNALLRVYALQFQPYAASVSSLSLSSRLTLSTTDPTVTPQVLTHVAAAFGPKMDPGTLIPSADYRDTLTSQNTDDLAKQSTLSWYTDQNGQVWFKQRAALSTPWILQSGPSMTAVDIEADTNLSVVMSGDLYRNRQTITHVSNTLATSNSFAGDGRRRDFPLSFKIAPGTIPTVTRNGLSQSVGIKGSTGFQWLYKEKEQTIAQDPSQVILSSNEVLTVSYTGFFESSLTLDNTAAQQVLAKLEGGTGIIEQITDGQGIDVTAATMLANQLLQFYSNSGRSITFKTYRNGLQVGQILPIFLPEHNLLGARMYITQIDVTMQTQPNNTILYAYIVQATELPNTGSWQKLIASGLTNQNVPGAM